MTREFKGQLHQCTVLCSRMCCMFPVAILKPSSDLQVAVDLSKRISRIADQDAFSNMKELEGGGRSWLCPICQKNVPNGCLLCPSCTNIVVFFDQVSDKSFSSNVSAYYKNAVERITSAPAAAALSDARHFDIGVVAKNISFCGYVHGEKLFAVIERTWRIKRMTFANSPDLKTVRERGLTPHWKCHCAREMGVEQTVRPS